MTLLPPPQYDVPPPMPVIEYVLAGRDVTNFCSRALLEEGPWRGCSFFSGGNCYIVRIDMPDVARHERAHCAGWPADHPGGWYDIYKDRR